MGADGFWQRAKRGAVLFSTAVAYKFHWMQTPHLEQPVITRYVSLWDCRFQCSRLGYLFSSDQNLFMCQTGNFDAHEPCRSAECLSLRINFHSPPLNLWRNGHYMLALETGSVS